MTAITQVVEQLEEDIVFGRLRPRERLIEEDLAARFGVKRHGIRDALAQLERKGVVVRRPGKGARVPDFAPGEIEHLFAVRELLESQAARLMPLPAAAALVDRLSDLHAVHGNAVAAADLRTVFRANIEFHEVLFAACGNPYLAEAIDAFALKSHAVRFYSAAAPDLLALARDEHGLMIEALRDGHRERLVALCIAHLQPARQAYLDANQGTYGAAAV
jgi:DNA-binding GntR family transcriptional regulator